MNTRLRNHDGSTGTQVEFVDDRAPACPDAVLFSAVSWSARDQRLASHRPTASHAGVRATHARAGQLSTNNGPPMA